MPLERVSSGKLRKSAISKNVKYLLYDVINGKKDVAEIRKNISVINLDIPDNKPIRFKYCWGMEYICQYRMAAHQGYLWQAGGQPAFGCHRKDKRTQLGPLIVSSQKEAVYPFFLGRSEIKDYLIDASKTFTK